MHIVELKKQIRGYEQDHISWTYDTADLLELVDSHDDLLLAMKTVANHDKCVLYHVLIEAIRKAEPDYDEDAFAAEMDQKNLDDLELEIAADIAEGK